MNKAYIILVHKNPEQILRLVKRLNDGTSSFFIHLDKSVDIKPFEILYSLNNKVSFVKRVNSKWATFGLVECVLNALKEVQQSDHQFDRIILLSGQDYPIKSNNYIDHYLKQSPYSVFFEYRSLPDHQKWPENKGGLYRVDKYFLGLQPYQLFLSKSINFLSLIFPPLKRKIPNQMRPFAGSQWWIIDQHALNYIVDFLTENPQYIDFHKYTFGSDELFFQMILLNSKDQKLLSSIQNNHLRFMNWKTAAAAHPEVLGEKDFSDIQQSPALFARKFDLNADSNILNLIDKQCLLNPVYG